VDCNRYQINKRHYTKNAVQGEKDLMNFKALQAWDAKTYGFRLPESEFREIWDYAGNGHPIQSRDFPGFAMLSTVISDSTKHADIRVRCLAIFAIPHIREAWMINTTDPKVRADAETYFTKIDSLATRQAIEFKNSVPGAQVMKLQGMHYIFITNKSEVLNAINGFMPGR
jgi:hypothetical protein